MMVQSKLLLSDGFQLGGCSIQERV